MDSTKLLSKYLPESPDRKTKNGFWCTNRLLAKRRAERMGARLNEPYKAQKSGIHYVGSDTKKLSEHLSGKETGNINSGRY